MSGRTTSPPAFYSFYQAENDLFGVVDQRRTTPSTIYGPIPNRQRRAGRVLSCRSPPPWPVHHPPRRRALLHLSRRTQRVRHLSPHRRNRRNPPPALGSARLLRPLLSARADPDTVSSSFSTTPSSSRPAKTPSRPIPRERDEEHQFGIQIPYKGWLLDVANVKNRVNNFLDHSNLGESSMYFPIAVDGALVRAWELTLRSPRAGASRPIPPDLLQPDRRAARQHHRRLYLQRSPTDPACDLGPDYTPVDHDQRHTLNTGFTANLPAHTWFSTNVYYGSGFSNGLPRRNARAPTRTPICPCTPPSTFGGHNIGEKLEALRQHPQRHQPPRPAR